MSAAATCDHGGGKTIFVTHSVRWCGQCGALVFGYGRVLRPRDTMTDDERATLSDALRDMAIAMVALATEKEQLEADLARARKALERC